MATFGVGGVVSASIWLGDRSAGTLNLFDFRARNWTATDRFRIAAFAGGPGIAPPSAPRAALTMADDQLIDNDALDRSLRHLRREASDGELTGALQQVLVATRGLFSAAGAGFMMIDDTSMLRFVAATDEPGRLLESRQQEIGHGPCVDSLTFDRVICTSDLALDDRWPALLPELPEAGVRALLGVPIQADRMPIGR